jgi:DNA-binding SARP family transcriptional activator
MNGLFEPAKPSSNGSKGSNGVNGSNGFGGAHVLRMRVFGGFEASIDGVPVSLERIKPRARSLLRLLAASSATAVHREVIGAALWPEADGQTAARSLQVAISAIRGLFVELLGSAGTRLIVREGDAYRLAVAPEAIDVRGFEGAITEARNSRGRDVAGSAAALTRALDLYRGDLLPEEGPAEWVVELREHYRTLAVDVAREVAEGALVAGDARSAIDACRVGLAIDRYHDPLWRLLIEARNAAGDVSAANRDRLEYEAILSELGLPATAAFSAT